ncbi:hypothetical protein NP233_g1752 [Leucocoprinus birnbaumii]|uniref:Mitochondrial carrier n=1 Tax=Leucocoprinus birnbaumii TaxID=56174 RepID=A0AAD5W5A9_9AGAR|nr:hypothetical protein NP233_g1752 [Leucocoprinus birnbaumii]
MGGSPTRQQSKWTANSMIAGAGGGLVASIATCPLDVVKTKLQAQRVLQGQAGYLGIWGTVKSILFHDGFRGLYRGLGPTILGYLPTWAIYFAVYDFIKTAFGEAPLGAAPEPEKVRHGKGDQIYPAAQVKGYQPAIREHPWSLHLLSAMTAGAASTCATNPLWVIKTRFMTQSRAEVRYRHTWDAALTIYRTEGIAAFYRGLVPSLLGILHVAVQFPLYEKLKYLMARDSGRPLTPQEILMCSAASKMTASIATYPHEVIRTRLQTQKRPLADDMSSDGMVKRYPSAERLPNLDSNQARFVEDPRRVKRGGDYLYHAEAGAEGRVDRAVPWTLGESCADSAQQRGNDVDKVPLSFDPMTSTRPQLSPWPQQTPVVAAQNPLPEPTAPAYGRSTTRRRRDSHRNIPRQVIADQSQVERAANQCQLLSGNDIISCFPTAGTEIPQHQWAAFVWNSRRPELTQTNQVNLYLFRADSGEQILQALNITNPFGQAGIHKAQVDDSWFGTDGLAWNGTNQTFPYQWVISRNDTGLDGSQISQPIFSAVQTTYLDSVISSSLSSAAAASSASVLSSLSAVAASSSRAANSPTSSSGSGSVQADSSGSGFPHWAIAVITVLGFLAIASVCILAFLILRRLRRRNEEIESNRNSMGSSSPMMANAQQQGSPLLGTPSLPPPPHSPVGTGSASAAAGAGLAGGAAMSERERNAPSVVIHDGASTTSAGDSGPFSGADAAIMADAFRKMLRKPDFERLEEGDDSPDGGNEDDDDDNRRGPSGAGLIGRELAEEGRDIRSVSSERGVRVETGTIDDAGSAALDFPSLGLWWDGPPIISFPTLNPYYPRYLRQIRPRNGPTWFAIRAVCSHAAFLFFNALAPLQY